MATPHVLSVIRVIFIDKFNVSGIETKDSGLLVADSYFIGRQPWEDILIFLGEGSRDLARRRRIDPFERS